MLLKTIQCPSELLRLPRRKAFLLASIAFSVASPGLAQSVAPAPLEDPNTIIVTGLKRDQAFLDVPVSVSVFSAETIAQAGVTRPQDFLSLTPNVTFIQTNHAGEAFVNIRGQASVRQAESAVAVVIDGVQLATQNEFNGELFDIAQIEILKGPQSALYGRNATAGAIIITTKAPTDDLEGQVNVTYGNWNTMRFTGGVGGAIVPGILRFRVSAALADTDGPFKNINNGENVMRSNEKVGRFRLDWTPSDVFKADLRFNVSRLSGGGIAATAIAIPSVVAGVPVTSDFDMNDFSRIPFTSDVRGYNIQNKWSTSLKLDYDLGFATLTSVTSYNFIRDDYGAKNFPYANFTQPGTNFNVGVDWASAFGDLTQNYSISNRAFIQEFGLSSNNVDSRLRWMAGFFFLDSKRQFISLQGQNASGVITPGFDINGPGTSNPTTQYDKSRYTAQNYSPFANIQFDLTDNLELSVAGRYDTEKRTGRTLTPDIPNLVAGRPTYNLCVLNTGLSADQCSGEATFRSFQPKVTLIYKLPGTGSLFASWGKGFKSGGFNPIGTRQTLVNAIVGAGGSPAQVFVQDAYGKETSNAFEVGFKSELFDRALSFNGAAFLTNVKGAQQFEFNPIAGIQAVSSIDEVKIKGFELDAQVRFATWATLFGSVGYIDSKIDKLLSNPQFVGNRTPYVADITLNGGVQLSPPISDTLTLNMRLEVNHSGSMWFDAGNQLGTRRDPLTLANVRVGVETDKWDLSIWSRNLFDRRYSAESVPLVAGALQAGFKGFPRSVGVDARYKF